MLHNMRIGPLACWLLALLAAGHAGDARSAATLPAVGETVESAVDLAGKQVVLPGGSWTVAGHGFDQVPGLDDVAYGAIENVVLFRIVDSRVAAFVLAQHNVIATERGWGFAPECRRSDLLHSIVWDGADGHSFCGYRGPSGDRQRSTASRRLEVGCGLRGGPGPCHARLLADGRLSPQQSDRHARRSLPLRSSPCWQPCRRRRRRLVARSNLRQRQRELGRKCHVLADQA